MLEKILQKLKTQRGNTSNVSDRSLEDLAKSYETVITTDEILAKADFKKAIDSIDGNINNYTAGAITRAKEKEAADLLAKKEADEAAKRAEKLKLKDEDKDDKNPTPVWAEALLESNKLMTDRLAKLETDKTTTTRKQQLEQTLKDTPDYFKNPLLESFKRTNFETDEDFTAYAGQIKTTSESFIQTAKEQGLLKTTPKADVRVPTEDGQTPELGDALKLITTKKE